MKLIIQFKSKPCNEHCIDSLGICSMIDLELLRFLLDLLILCNHLSFGQVFENLHAGRVNSQDFFVELLRLLRSLLCILPLKWLEIPSLKLCLHEYVG